MKLDQIGKFVTLDWDNIDLQVALIRFSEIAKSDNTIRTILSLSPRKGYHVRIWLRFAVRLVIYRLGHSDDPRRLYHDLVNRPPHIHDILWIRKTTKLRVDKERMLIDHTN